MLYVYNAHPLDLEEKIVNLLGRHCRHMGYMKPALHDLCAARRRSKYEQVFYLIDSDNPKTLLGWAITKKSAWQPVSQWLDLQYFVPHKHRGQGYGTILLTHVLNYFNKTSKNLVLYDTIESKSIRKFVKKKFKNKIIEV